MTNATTTKCKAQRAAEHQQHKAEAAAAAAARREAERAHRKERAEARAADRRAIRSANAERRRRVRAQRAHDALMRRVFGLRRDFASAPLETDDGMPFVSIEFGDDPAAPSLFILQRDLEGERQIVLDGRTGKVVARGATREAALRAFARTLPAVVVMPPYRSKAWPAAWRAHMDRKRARIAASAAN